MAAIKSSDENTRQVNVSIYVMYIMYVMWMVAFLTVVSSKPTGKEPGTDIVTEILTVIDGREEMRTVVGYLNSSRDELIKEMPLLDPDGTKLNYTFFAPTSLAFLLQTAQDTVDPLFVDANLRLTVLIRHFTRQSVSTNDLARLDRIVMADSNVAAITRSADMKTFINGAEIQAGATPLLTSFGVVYIVDRVFVDGREVNDAITAHLQRNAAIVPGLPWSPSVMSPVVPDAKAIEEPSVSLPGSVAADFKRVSSSEIDVQNIAIFITTSLSAKLASPLVLLSIVEAETQMVAGVNYRLQLKFMSQMKSEENTLIFCRVVVFNQP